MIISCTAEAGAILPTYESAGSAGADMYANLDSTVVINAGERKLLETGIHMQIPPGYEGQVRPRSGLAVKHGISVLNSPGTIDSDYRGEIKVILINLGNAPFTVSHGDRIAQLVICPVIQAEFAKTESLDHSRRGERGFGSTGL